MSGRYERDRESSHSHSNRNRNRNRNGEEEEEKKKSIPPFKAAQIRYRRSSTSKESIRRMLESGEVVDFDGVLSSSSSSSSTWEPNQRLVYRYPLFRLGEYGSGHGYGLHGYPGFVAFTGVLSEAWQHRLAFLALSVCCEPPHGTNLDLNVDVLNVDEVPPEKDRLWERWKRERTVPSSTSTKPSCRHRHRRCLDNLSWASLGYRYDWTARTYVNGGLSKVPHTLARLARELASVGELVSTSTSTSPLVAEASIVNYYGLKSAMGGHADDAEYALDQPVVSWSLGLPAIFLLGGFDKDGTDSVVVPILVRPGDVMLLGGNARLRYHGIGRILDTDDVPMRRSATTHWDHLDLSNELQRDWDEGLSQWVGAATTTTDRIHSNFEQQFRTNEHHVREYLSQHRINMNVRQVLTASMDEIPSHDTRERKHLSQRRT